MDTVTITVSFEEWNQIKALALNSVQKDSHQKVSRTDLPPATEEDYPAIIDLNNKVFATADGMASLTTALKALPSTGSTTPTTSPTTPANPTPVPAAVTNLLVTEAFKGSFQLVNFDKREEALSIVKDQKYVATVDIKSKGNGGGCEFELVKPDGSGEGWSKLPLIGINKVYFTGTASASRRLTVKANGDSITVNSVTFEKVV
jgi:hypothetical protein